MTTPDTPFPAYTGNDKYIFVSYAHSDARIVYPQLERLKRLGYNVWYDEGVSPGSRWSDELALRIHHCSLFLVLVTPNVTQSVHCQDELNYVLEANRPVLAVHLTKTELPPGLKLRLGARQAIFAYSLNDNEIDRKLSEALSAVGVLKDSNHQPMNEAALDLEPGDYVGNFRLLEVLGEGGMGTVFLAEQREPVARRVALKVIKLGMDTKEVLARFEAERQALAVLSHPNIATVFEGGATSTGRPYFVLEYVPGVPITKYCDDRKLDFKARVRLLKQACNGILHAHQKGIIHRDIKASNLVVYENSGEPLVKIIDFGIAKSMQGSLANITLFTRLGDTVGSPGYASPEQMGGMTEDIDTRTDVYSLGIVLYELLCGARPFDDETLLNRDAKQISKLLRELTPPQPSTRLPRSDQLTDIAVSRASSADRIASELRGDLSSIVMRAIQSDRDERYPSVVSLTADLDRWLTGAPVEASPQTPAYLFSRFVKRHSTAVATGFAVFILLLGASIISTYSFIRASQEAERANMLATQSQTTVDFLLKLFEGSGPDNNPDPSTTARQLLDQGAERLIEEGELNASIRLQLAETIADVYLRLWLPERAISLLRETIAATITGLGDSNIFILRARIKLGDVLRANDDLNEARSVFEQVRVIIYDVPEVTDDDKAKLANNLALVLVRMGEPEAAEPLYLEALAIRQQESNGRTLPVAVTMHNMGLLYTSTRQLDLAEKYTRMSLDIRRELFDDEHPRVASTTGVLSSILRLQGKFSEAEKAIKQTLNIQEKVFGKDSVSIAISSYNLARILIFTGKWQEAIDAFNRAMDIDGASTVDWALSAYRLAFLKESMGEYAEAMSLAEESTPIMIERYSEQNRHVARLQSLKARLILRLQGDLSKAESIAREGLRTNLALHGESDTRTALARITLAEILNARGQSDIAIEMAKQAIDIARSDTEVTKPSLAAALEGMVRIYAANQNLDGACGHFRELQELRITYFNSEHPYNTRLHTQQYLCQ